MTQDKVIYGFSDVRRDWLQLLQGLRKGDKFMRLGSGVVFSFNEETGVLENSRLTEDGSAYDTCLRYDDYYANDWVILQRRII